jgi:hypothetical protein
MEASVIHRSGPGNRQPHGSVARAMRRYRPASRLLAVLGLALAAVLNLGGCGPGTQTGSPALDSGISGLTVAGPQCPVEIAGQPCPPKPVSARVAVQDAAGQQLTAFDSDAQGRFRLPLSPGAYVLVSSGDPGGPLLKPVQVTVLAGQYVELQLMLDTGIR